MELGQFCPNRLKSNLLKIEVRFITKEAKTSRLSIMSIWLQNFEKLENFKFGYHDERFYDYFLRNTGWSFSLEHLKSKKLLSGLVAKKLAKLKSVSEYLTFVFLANFRSQPVLSLFNRKMWIWKMSCCTYQRIIKIVAKIEHRNYFVNKNAPRGLFGWTGMFHKNIFFRWSSAWTETKNFSIILLFNMKDNWANIR